MAPRSLSGPLSPSSEPNQLPTSSERPYLTAVGRQLLEERIRVVQQTVTELDEALGDAESRRQAVEAHQRANQELARLQGILRDAQSVEQMPDDPSTVELGDSVVISLPDGRTEIYVIVDSAEAPLDDARISIGSPLGRALLGRKVGDEVEVHGPRGSYRCTILTASRR